MFQYFNDRYLLSNGIATSQESVPVPSRAFNNEVACVMMQCLQFEFDICLTGLCSAAHFNGREGVIRGPDPACTERWSGRHA